VEIAKSISVAEIRGFRGMIVAERLPTEFIVAFSGLGIRAGSSAQLCSYRLFNPRLGKGMDGAN
jgi:hypothetical protein